MKKEMKLHVLLAKTEQTAKSFKKSNKDYTDFFRKSQGAFTGEKRTYTAKEGMTDEPSKRGNRLVQTTVGEKLKWMEETFSDHVTHLMSLESTNASGTAKAKLVVDGQEWGEFTSLELLRLKSLVESSELRDVYENIPVRSDAEEWKESDNEMYAGRDGIFESPLLEGVAKTTEKESYILEDPNIGKLKDSSSYSAQVAQKSTIVELGNYTSQKFTGEWSQRQKAELLRRRENLVLAIIEALKEANEVAVVESQLTAEKIFGYLHGSEKD